MGLNSGFFDSLLVNGEYDRPYSAADYCDNLATVIKNGVRYSADDDLNVTAGNGMALTVAAGRAWINGHFLHNDTDYTELTIGTAPTGSNKRIDAVVVRLDTSVAYRNITLAIKQGTAAVSPVMPEMTRSGDIYELCLATVEVVAGATSITADKITDQRANGTVCGWASSVTPAIMSMLRKYEWVQTLDAASKTVTFDIPQYDAADVHILEVYTNGFLETLGDDYTLSGRTLTFTLTRQAGAEIKVILYKSIDGTGLESAAEQIAEMQNTIAGLVAMDNYIYECNGVNDNVVLSQLVQEYLDGGTDYGCRKISVVGTIGILAAAGGTGTQTSNYKWFEFGKDASTNRKVIIDFSNCSAITIPITGGTYNTIFYGNDVHIIGANVIASNNATGTYIRMFNSAAGVVVAEDCRFWITADITSYISQTGTFVRCRGSVTCSSASAYCFYPTAEALLRVIGGEYYAYTASAYTSAVVYMTAATAIAALYALNCPTMARSGFVQSYAVYATNGLISLTDTITTLAISATGANIRGTLAASRPGMM